MPTEHLSGNPYSKLLALRSAEYFHGHSAILNILYGLYEGSSKQGGAEPLYSRPTSPAGLNLYGPTGIGKTSLIHAFETFVTADVEADGRRGTPPVLYANLRGLPMAHYVRHIKRELIAQVDVADLDKASPQSSEPSREPAIDFVISVLEKLWSEGRRLLICWDGVDAGIADIEGDPLFEEFLGEVLRRFPVVMISQLPIGALVNMGRMRDLSPIYTFNRSVRLGPLAQDDATRLMSLRPRSGLFDLLSQDEPSLGHDLVEVVYEQVGGHPSMLLLACEQLYGGASIWVTKATPSGWDEARLQALRRRLLLTSAIETTLGGIRSFFARGLWPGRVNANANEQVSVSLFRSLIDGVDRDTGRFLPLLETSLRSDRQLRMVFEVLESDGWVVSVGGPRPTRRFVSPLFVDYLEQYSEAGEECRGPVILSGAFLDDVRQRLSVRDRRVLDALAAVPGRVHTYQELHALISVDASADDATASIQERKRVLDGIIYRIRQALREVSRRPDLDYLRNHSGVGYEFRSEPASL